MERRQSALDPYKNPRLYFIELDRKRKLLRISLIHYQATRSLYFPFTLSLPDD